MPFALLVNKTGSPKRTTWACDIQWVAMLTGSSKLTSTPTAVFCGDRIQHSVQLCLSQFVECYTVTLSLKQHKKQEDCFTTGAVSLYLTCVHFSRSHTCLQWHCDMLSPVTLDNSPPSSLQLSHDWSVQRFLFYSVAHILQATTKKKKKQTISSLYSPVQTTWQYRPDHITIACLVY